MRFFFIGLIIIFLVSLLVGQLATPKYTPFKAVMAKGLYYTIIGLIGFGVAVALAALIYEGISSQGSDTEFARMTKEQKKAVRDSLRKELPDPTREELLATFVEFDFDAVVIPCYSTVHKLDVASLKEIKAFEVGRRSLSDGFYEIETNAEMEVNRPVPGFHLRGTFIVQYEFFEGDSDIDPGWKFDKVFISTCEVLGAQGEQEPNRKNEYYPDLPREVD